MVESFCLVILLMGEREEQKEKQFLHQTAHNKFCGLFLSNRVMISGMTPMFTDVLFLWNFELHKLSAIVVHYIQEQQTSLQLISPKLGNTQHNSTTVKRMNCPHCVT